MKYFYYLIITSLVIHATNIGNDKLLINGSNNSNWYKSSIDLLEKNEYNISYSTNFSAYQTPNRKNNLRFIYKSNGFFVEPRTPISNKWNAEFTVLGYGRSNKIENTFKGKEFRVLGNTAYIQDSNMIIEYINDEKGMRQNFIINNKPISQHGDLTLSFEIKTNQNVTIEPDLLTIESDNKEVMRYSSLKIWDAEGRILNGKFIQSDILNNNLNNKIEIVVDDNKAIYPVTIDPLSSTADWTKTGDQSKGYYGFEVTTAGDVNGDGFSDIIISAPNYDLGYRGQGAVFMYFGSASTPNNTHNWVGKYDQAECQFGYSISTAGDLNNDGYSDIIIGAPYYDKYISNQGGVFVYYGNSSGLGLSPVWNYFGSSQDENFGYSVSTAGDVDGDGYSDVIVGAPNYSNGQTNEGAVFAFYSGLNGLGNIDWSYEYNSASANLGNSVALAGDVNGDGFSDIIVGLDGYDKFATNGGAVLSFYGSNSGLQNSEDWELTENQTEGKFGNKVKGAGDVNGDGYSDVIVGAQYFDQGQADEGIVLIYHGSPTGLSNTSSWQNEGDQIGANYGSSISTAGDINGDGFSDVIIGASGMNDGGTENGSAFVYYGSPSGISTTFDWKMSSSSSNSNYGNSVSTAGDINGDGFSDVIVGAAKYDAISIDEGAAYVYFGNPDGLSTVEDWMVGAFTLQATSTDFGNLTTAGDVNGDGFSDIIVSDKFYSNGQNNEGSIYVYHGSDTGLVNNYSIQIESDATSSRFGSSISTAGDVNGDGFDDIIIGAPHHQEPYYQQGKVYLFYGSSNGIVGTPAWTKIPRYGGDWLGKDVSTAGDVNGDGYSDVIIGSSNLDTVYCFYGSETGLSNNANLKITPINEFSNGYGRALSLAGDINGDGFDDIIVGHSSFGTGGVGSNARIGKIYLYLGSGTGLESTPHWSAVGEDIPNYKLGENVTTAGDVNADGYSDFLVSCANGTNGTFISLYYGSSTNISSAPDLTFPTSTIFEQFSTAGDVNGDGYSDIIIGNSSFSDNENNEGRVIIYLGSVNGIQLNNYIEIQGNYEDARYGRYVASGGDVNGDGFSDVLVRGDYLGYLRRVFAFYGNGSDGITSNLTQQQPNDNSILAASGLSESFGNIRIGLKAKSPFGRTDGRIVYEFKPNGVPYSAGNGKVTNSTNYTDVGSFTDLGSIINGTEIFETISGVLSEYSYKWRARIEYDLSSNPFQKYGPWKYYNNYAVHASHGFKARTTIPPSVYAKLNVYIEGPFNSLTNTMGTQLDLSTQLTHPYSSIHNGSESVSSNFFTSHPEIVDWIVVELRTTPDASSKITSRAAFLTSDKTIIDLDGIAGVTFDGINPELNYYIVVHHRNHLSVMSSTAVKLPFK